MTAQEELLRLRTLLEQKEAELRNKDLLIEKQTAKTENQEMLIEIGKEINRTEVEFIPAKLKVKQMYLDAIPKQKQMILTSPVRFNHDISEATTRTLRKKRKRK